MIAPFPEKFFLAPMTEITTPALRRIVKDFTRHVVLYSEMISAGALVSNAGCAGCAAGQVGQNGPGEVTVSTGNRNFAGKQGKGEVYLASPTVVAASAVAGVLTLPGEIPDEPVLFATGEGVTPLEAAQPAARKEEKSETFTGRVWVVRKDNIDTDMIFHNRYLTITDIAEMGQYTFDNLEGWEDFASRARAGDIVVIGSNFGCGSSRQQAVDCFPSLGVQAVIAQSYGAIYERNAINAGFPVVVADVLGAGLENGQEITVNLATGVVTWDGGEVAGAPFSDVQMQIYRRGGLLAKS